MPTIEILAYQPKDMDKFIAFCANGKRKANGDFDVDGQLRKMTGVFDWLHARKVPEAHFFNSAKTDKVQLFVATVHRLEDNDVPWTNRIPGFEDTIKTDGLFGTTDKFGTLNTLLAAVKSNADLDAKFAAKKDKLDQVFERLQQGNTLSVNENQLLATLRGDKGTDLDVVTAEIKGQFGISL
jgi:hypothetical protein